MAQYISQTMSTTNVYVKYRIVANTISKSIENNTTIVNVQVQAWRTNSGYTTYGTGTCYCSVQGTWYSAQITSSQKITQNSYTVLFDRDITVYHANDGSCTLHLSSYISHAVLSSDEQHFYQELPSIPRASQPTLSKTDFNIGEEITINTNRVSNSFTHDILLLMSDGSYSTIATGVTDNYIWKTGDELYEQCPNSQQFSSSILVKTYNSDSYIGEKSTGFCAITTDCAPICENISYKQINDTVQSLVGNNTDIILTKSEILVTFSDATAKKYAEIKKYYVQIGDKIFESDDSEFSIFDIPNADTIYGWVKDSRNFDSSSSKAEATLGKIYEYSPPTMSNIQINRENDVGENTYLTFSASVSNIIAVNSAYYICWHSKQNEDINWGNMVNIVNLDYNLSNFSYDSLLGTFSTDENFNFEIIIGDSFGEYTYPCFLQKSKPELSIRDNMLGINCVPIDNNGTLQINGKSLLDLTYPVGSVYMSVNPISPETLFGGKWESINDTFLLCAGSTYPAGSSGGETSHTLTINEMPSHFHNLYSGWTSPAYTSNSTDALMYQSKLMSVNYKNAGNGYEFMQRVGNGQAHNNMPPYIAVYCWKRVE